MTDEEFKETQETLRDKIIELNDLQNRYRKETGRDYVISGPLKGE